MHGYVGNIERRTLENTFFRKVLYTTERSQLVLMALQPGEDIGTEIHPEHDQFIRVEAGEGAVTLNGVTTAVNDGSAIVIPAGTEHDLTNTGKEVLRLYTLYTPPEHKDGVVHETKADVAEEHFDGVTSE